MNPENGSFDVCMKHPSQFFTGFCSICLFERLSNVDSVETIKKIPSCDEIREKSELVLPDSQRKNDALRMRKTLLSLFEIDDLKELEKIGLPVFDGSMKSKKGQMPKVGTFGNQKARHSWDGCMMGKALACSFSCLDERRETLRDEASTSYVANDGGFGEQRCRGKKWDGWGRVWDWSIISPFRDFAKRNGNALERSMSESWRDNKNAKNLNVVDVVVAKPDLQKMRDFRISRSQSFRYSSPRNIDNGLLRFYLTPLRTSRRNSAKCRTRTPHSLARGFLGP